MVPGICDLRVAIKAFANADTGLPGVSTRVKRCAVFPPRIADASFSRALIKKKDLF